VSPITARQITWALENGFVGIPFDSSSLLQGEAATESAISQAVEEACRCILSGKDPLLYTARGSDDPEVARFRAAVRVSGVPSEVAHQRLGMALGQALRRVLEQTDVRRAILSGGDTSGYATQQLGVYALTARNALTPGASLCLAHTENPRLQGLELALKGGQMGTVDYFGQVRG
jgi:uncharacterized protein YgbK (DUF1537 family)